MKLKDLDLVSVLSVTDRIKIALKKLPDDEVFRAIDFARLAKIQSGDTSKQKNAFKDNACAVGSKLFWGSEKAIKLLKEKLK